MQFTKKYEKPTTHFVIECHVYVDDQQKTVHILDTNDREHTTVTNGIDVFFEDIMRDAEALPHDDYTVIVYCTDGVPFRYGNPGFLPVPKHLRYEPFQRISEDYVN